MTSYPTPKGMRDYAGAVMERRRRMINTIEAVYRQWGYQPLSTPAMETVQTLAAKKGSDLAVGAEIAGQVFKIQDSELALRFDLTVPLARYAASANTPKPYKRYAIAPVWRREEPQKGRLREFLQADADIIGSPSMRAEAELLAMASAALRALGLTEFEILVNNRKILQGLILKMGLQAQETAVFRALDKLDKIGAAGARAEMERAGVQPAQIDTILRIIRDESETDNARTLEKAEQYSEDGVAELTSLLELLEGYGLENVRMDLSLVRGLGYYTGPIFEIRAGGGVGSVSGGGRYDNLLGLYGQADSAVGISLGIERLLALQEDREQKEGSGVRASPTQVLVIGFDAALQNKVLAAATQLRNDGLCVETDLNERPMRKQLDYANATAIPFALFAGKKEIESGRYTLKDLRNGQQKELTLEQVAEAVLEASEGA